MCERRSPGESRHSLRARDNRVVVAPDAWGDSPAILRACRWRAWSYAGNSCVIPSAARNRKRPERELGHSEPPGKESPSSRQRA